MPPSDRDVKGRCPACGRATLVLGDGGWVTCTALDCPNPGLASESISTVEQIPSSHSELRGWWEATSTADLEAMLPKLGEYTSADLVIMGDALVEWGTDALPLGAAGQEAACLFYILGKVARAIAALREGRLPSDDTYHDITVYSMMTRRIRERGGWPGGTEKVTLESFEDGLP